MKRKQLQKGKYYIFIITVISVTFSPVLFSIFHLKYDFFDYTYPIRYYIGDCLRHGIFPYWIPYMYCGLPLHADPQSELFYPITWLTSLILGNKMFALQIEFVVHICIAGIGFFKLSNYFFKNNLIATILGLSYALSGFFIGHAQHYSYIISATWIPFILYYLLKTYNHLSIISSSKLALTIMFLVTGGYPAFYIILLYIVIFIFLYYVYTYIKYHNRHKLCTFLRLNILVLLLVLVLCTGYIISVIHGLDYITRGDGITLSKALEFPFSPKALISLILPNATVVNPSGYYNSEISMINAYMGITVFVFFVLSFFITRNNIYYILLFVSVFFLFISFGEGFYLREFLYRYIPGMNYFRFPSIFRYFFIIGVLLCSGFAFRDSCFQKTNSKIHFVITLTLLIALILLILILKVKFNLHIIDFIRHDLFQRTNNTLPQHIFLQAIIQVGIIFILLVAFFLYRKKQYFKYVILLAVSVDLLASSLLNSPFTVYYTSWNRKELARYEKTFPKAFPNPSHKKPISITNKSLANKYYWRNLGIFQKQIAYEGYSPFNLETYNNFTDSLTLLFKSTLQNKVVYLSSEIHPLDSLKNDLQQKNINPCDVYLEKKIYDTIQIKPGSKSWNDTCMLQHYSPQHLKINVQADSPLLLVLIQNKFPGWIAEVNNTQVDILCINSTFQGVIVPKGNSTVQFKYRPKAAIIGTIVSVLTFILIILFLLLKINPRFHRDDKKIKKLFVSACKTP